MRRLKSMKKNEVSTALDLTEKTALDLTRLTALDLTEKTVLDLTGVE